MYTVIENRALLSGCYLNKTDKINGDFDFEIPYSNGMVIKMKAEIVTLYESLDGLEFKRIENVDIGTIQNISPRQNVRLTDFSFTYFDNGFIQIKSVFEYSGEMKIEKLDVELDHCSDINYLIFNDIKKFTYRLIGDGILKENKNISFNSIFFLQDNKEDKKDFLTLKLNDNEKIKIINQKSGVYTWHIPLQHDDFFRIYNSLPKERQFSFNQIKLSINEGDYTYFWQSLGDHNILDDLDFDFITICENCLYYSKLQTAESALKNLRENKHNKLKSSDCRDVLNSLAELETNLSLLYFEIPAVDRKLIKARDLLYDKKMWQNMAKEAEQSLYNALKNKEIEKNEKTAKLLQALVICLTVVSAFSAIKNIYDAFGLKNWWVLPIFLISLVLIIIAIYFFIINKKNKLTYFFSKYFRHNILINNEKGNKT
jgi:hypothetical protein